MKKIIYFMMAVSVMGASAGCGDNKTKEKLLGTTVYNSSGSGGGTTVTSTPEESTADMSADSATMTTLAGQGGASAFLAPGVNGAFARAYQASKVPTGLTGPDADGYYTYSGFSDSTMKIRFQKADGSAVNFNTNPADMANLARVRVRLTSNYSFGNFSGDFTMFVTTNTTEMTIESGTITLSNDPGGLGGFTATISNMVLEMVGSGASTYGLPKQGSMTITSTLGTYTGTGTYSKSGTNYLYTGDISAFGSKVAEVHLTYSSTLGNYTGYWVNTVTNDGIQHQITGNISRN
ncbi:MAG: hypothetical protein JW803_04765 [Endomicrobiales bacterium]|nr:hypothetical protein [Endomicrobiales bacterium]